MAEPAVGDRGPRFLPVMSLRQ